MCPKGAINSLYVKFSILEFFNGSIPKIKPLIGVSLDLNFI